MPIELLQRVYDQCIAGNFNIFCGPVKMGFGFMVKCSLFIFDFIFFKNLITSAGTFLLTHKTPYSILHNLKRYFYSNKWKKNG